MAVCTDGDRQFEGVSLRTRALNRCFRSAAAFASVLVVAVSVGCSAGTGSSQPDAPPR